MYSLFISNPYMIATTKKDKAEVSDILISSFEDNRSIIYMVPPGPARIKRFYCLIQYSISTCLDFGRVVLSEDGRACALVLFPDKKRFTFSVLWRDLNLVWTIGLSSALRGMKRERLLKQRHPKQKL